MLARRGFLKLLGGLVMAGFGTTAYAIGIEPLQRPLVTSYAVKPANWPTGLKLRIVVLADIHACEPWMPVRRIASICDQASALGGDIILLLGDYMSSLRLTGFVEPARWAEALARLKAPLGVHAIVGNHDWLNDPVASLAGHGPTLAHTALAGVGIPVYDNRALRLEKDGHPFWLAGLSDQLEPSYPASDGAGMIDGLDDLPGTLAGIDGGDPIILMAHEPDIFVDVPRCVSLTLAGHTHGGQVRFLGYAPLVPSRYGNRYAYGHIIEDDRHMIVSGGLGLSNLPVRIGSPPEVVAIDIG
ncbi:MULTISPECIES: metallophosphoesterase [Sinorhizobium]|uniref:Metallophosphoesterase n=1 Tax=Sinorhizobium americanum TaxID=194963 RepID=A0A2S3YG39_9HYPH|nr:MULTISPECIES: metallophosphoesterase [Sinorhizobium]PDT40111.1 metallophosphoesterase [Sinorhizobium sp. FG01]POH25199.1 metallophosphoesterase [Sinorhizobium americanum]